MIDPINLDAYNRRYHLSQKVTGFGVGNVHVHSPCPFCAAPEWMVFEILSMEDTASKGATCKECKRSAKLVFTHSAGGVSFEVVQTGGDDPPAYLPKMRRVASA